MTRLVYRFGGGAAEGSKDLKDLLGGKGANLAEMARLGLPVPPGFTLTTDVCRAFFEGGGKVPAAALDELEAAVAHIERFAGARFGDAQNPLLVSVRSGARASMPGMMDTVLDLGLNDRTVEGLARATGDRRFAFDAYRRFCALYGSVVLGLGDEGFAQILEDAKKARGAQSDTDLTAGDLEQLVRVFRAAIAATGHELPDDPREQLVRTIEAVFRSWNNPRAIAYRELNRIPESWGTAVTVQAMVFGNLSGGSGTGVAFTRDPATGARELYGEFLADAQGEDVVAGVRTPQPIAEMGRTHERPYQKLREVAALLERHYRDIMDIEFTVQRGTLYVLQCRAAKRTGFAAVRAAVEMATEGLLTKDEAVQRVSPDQLEQLLRPTFADAEAGSPPLAKGLPAGPGAATGVLTLTAAEADAVHAKGQRVILAREETSPEDIRGMAAAEGLLTARGGMTSHAALVARQMGKVAVVGCGAVVIDEAAGTVTFPQGRVVRRGEWISLDGNAGTVFAGQRETRPSDVLRALLGAKDAEAAGRPHVRAFVQLLQWADAARRLGVRANADQGDQAAAAVALGAEGIGLCRTEHMFFGEEKLGPMREMILATTAEQRRAALAKILPLQRADFAAIFRAMSGHPVTVRTLDPPLHEFLPREQADLAALARDTGRTVEQVAARVAELAETNPMLGKRGCRLGIAYPEITEMQARAIFEAACDVVSEGFPVRPQIMIPLVGTRAELGHQAHLVAGVAGQVFADRGVHIDYRLGTMIEVPRAALVAGELALTAEFFSFGTNDLTQMTLGLSRDDVSPVLADYQQRGIYPADPFVTLDTEGVGGLMRTALEAGRHTRPDLEAGVCGEHGGDPASIAFCHRLGLDYVSCSPMRVPIARLAAAQAAIEGR